MVKFVIFFGKLPAYLEDSVVSHINHKFNIV